MDLLTEECKQKTDHAKKMERERNQADVRLSVNMKEKSECDKQIANLKK